MSEGPIQREDLEVNESADGLIVYDPERDRVHHLNLTASLVFSLCTGENRDADSAVVAEEVRGCLVTPRDEGLVR